MITEWRIYYYKASIWHKANTFHSNVFETRDRARTWLRTYRRMNPQQRIWAKEVQVKVTVL